MVAAAVEAPVEVEYHESVGSTNDRAVELACEGERNVAVVAREQTGGRGRRGRAWAAPPGGVYCSVVLEPDLSAGDAPILTLSGAVAVVRACEPLGLDPPLDIKWPNDVRHRGAKVAGVLTETGTAGDRLDWAVVGVGLNANVESADLPRGTSLRAALGRDVDRVCLTAGLVDAVVGLSGSPEDVLPAWRAAASTLGGEVRVETPDGAVVGTATDVEFPGLLVVETDDGRERVAVGDCEHLDPAR